MGSTWPTLHILWGKIEKDSGSSSSFERKANSLTSRMKGLVVKDSSSSSSFGVEDSRRAHSLSGGSPHSSGALSRHGSGHADRGKAKTEEREKREADQVYRLRLIAEAAANAKSSATSARDFARGSLDESVADRADDEMADADDSENSEADQDHPSDDPELATVGSALHRSGQCKPCHFNTLGQVCKHGKECTFCHFHPLYRRKRPGKRKRAKMARRLAAQAGQTEEPAPAGQAAASSAAPSPTTGGAAASTDPSRPATSGAASSAESPRRFLGRLLAQRLQQQPRPRGSSSTMMMSL